VGRWVGDSSETHSPHYKEYLEVYILSKTVPLTWPGTSGGRGDSALGDSVCSTDDTSDQTSKHLTILLKALTSNIGLMTLQSVQDKTMDFDIINPQQMDDRNKK